MILCRSEKTLSVCAVQNVEQKDRIHSPINRKLNAVHVLFAEPNSAGTLGATPGLVSVVDTAVYIPTQTLKDTVQHAVLLFLAIISG